MDFYLISEEIFTMIKIIINYIGIFTIVMVVSLLIILKNSKSKQVEEASNVIGRILPDYADQFILKIIEKEGDKDFFTGPAYNAFGRMGCIDGFGGPLPQSWIENENLLQKKILKRERQLGMTPVLQGFTGHIPPAFAKKNPNLNFSNLNWIDFPKTYLLDWEEPAFTKIGKDFISELIKEYGTDHLYAIDQFIEMKPVNGDTSYLKNMSKKIFSGIN